MENSLFTKIVIFTLAVLALYFISCTSKKRDEATWVSLLDKDLTMWNMYLSYEMKNGYNGKQPTDENGDTIRPIGYNTNYKNVFTVTEDNGIPILRVSGEVYGCVFTKDSYKNYHLRLKMKWGNKKWEPRQEKAYDSGILYHSQGECGVDYWRSWMLSHEFQLIESSDEGNSGDYWCIGSTQVDVCARKDSSAMFFDPDAPLIRMGAGTPNGHYCAASLPETAASGEWTDIELICYEGKSLHIVNGTVVMALSNLAYLDGDTVKPLIEGKIQLQSEAAEVFYKNIEIKTIDRLPELYTAYFR